MTNYKLNEEKMFCDINDGVAIIINSETGIYYGMNGFGTAVFSNIIEGISVDNILAALEKLSGVPADIKKRLNDFV
ncbi:MAG: PqqD family protein, partial [Rickettsiales bacterium]|nr:PqqD family protein [Rickettsiales bacterium]